MEYPLVTARLTLEPLGVADVAAFVAYRQVPEVTRFQSWDTDFSSDQGLGLVNSQIGVIFPGEGEWLQLGVHRRDTGELVGDLAIHNVADAPNQVEIGFTLATEHQGQGYALEAADCLLAAVREAGLATNFVAHTDARNASSIKLLKSLGLSERPELSWNEEFKGETVTVLRFETA